MDRNIFLIVLLVILAIFYIQRTCETFVSGSYDITAPITVDMDWKGAMLSKYPYYTNNLVNPTIKSLNDIQNLQKYNSAMDGPTDTTYVLTGMSVTQNIDNPDNREGFTMMNPYVQN